MIKVYVAGPYTKGDPGANVHDTILAAQKLWSHGYCPFVPHLSHLWHLIWPNPYSMWMKYDQEWLSVCDVLMRLPGESVGADQEVERAKQLGIPVVLDFMELHDNFPAKIES